MNTDAHRRPRRLWVLVGLLFAAGSAYFLSAPARRDALVKADLMRRQVRDAEKGATEEIEMRGKRRERAELMGRLAENPEDATTLLRAAALYGQDRHYEDALFLLHEARRLTPAQPEVYRALHQDYMSQGQYDRAYDYAVEGLKQAPDDLELTLGLVHLDTLVGWNTHARALLRRLEKTPHWANPRVRVASALVHRQVTDSRSAEADLQAALAREPRNDKVWALLSGVQWEIGKGREGEASIRKALEIQPENADYLLHLSEIQLRRRTPIEIEASRKSAEHALRADPGNRNAFFAVALALLAQKKYTEAREILEKLLERYPGHPQASFELARLYARSGKTTEAKRLLDEYAEGVRAQDDLKGLTLKVGMLPRDPVSHVGLGRLYNETGYPEKAVMMLRRALQLQPGHPPARKELARSLSLVNRAGEYGELARQPEWHAVDIMDTGVRGPGSSRPATAGP